MTTHLGKRMTNERTNGRTTNRRKTPPPLSPLTGTVVYRRGGIARLGPRGRGTFDHALEHLRRDDARFPLPPAFVDDGLLQYRHVLRGAFDPEIPPRDHYACSSLLFVVVVGDRCGGRAERCNAIPVVSRGQTIECIYGGTIAHTRWQASRSQ